MKKIVLVLAIFLLSLMGFSSICQSMEINIDPDIETVSSGPLYWKSGNEGFRFRVVVLLNEVYLNVFIQKIGYGDETCCAKVDKTYKLIFKGLKGNLYSISDMQWLSTDVFEFKGNFTNYRVTNLDDNYFVEKIEHLTK